MPVTQDRREQNYSIDHNYDESLRQARWRTTSTQYFRQIWGGSWRRFQNPWRRLTVFHQVAAEVGDNSCHRGVCWGKSGIFSASGEQGACNLIEIVGSPTYVGDIWSGIGLVGTDHGAGPGDVAAGRNSWPGTNAC